jgi:hypothetical protein
MRIAKLAMIQMVCALPVVEEVPEDWHKSVTVPERTRA